MNPQIVIAIDCTISECNNIRIYCLVNHWCECGTQIFNHKQNEIVTFHIFTIRFEVQFSSYMIQKIHIMTKNITLHWTCFLSWRYAGKNVPTRAKEKLLELSLDSMNITQCQLLLYNILFCRFFFCSEECRFIWRKKKNWRHGLQNDLNMCNFRAICEDHSWINTNDII